MRTLTCLWLVVASASGCVRLDIEGPDDPFLSATAVSEASSIVNCPLAIAASADGERFGVVWQEYAESWAQLVFAEVTAGGSVSSGPRTLFPVEADVSRVSLYANGSGYVAFYIADEHMWAAHTTGAGAEPVNTGWYPGNAVVVQNNDGFAVFYESEYRIHYQLVDQTGSSFGEQLLAMPVFKGQKPVTESPQVTFDAETGYHLVWNDYWGASLGYAHLDVNAAHITTEAFDFGTHKQMRIASDGAGSVVIAWDDGEFINEYALDAVTHEPRWNGVHRNIVGNRNESMDYAIAGGGGWVGLAWESDADSVLPQIYMTRYQVGSTSTPEIASLTSSDYRYSCPAVARGSSSFAVAFVGQVDGSQRLYVETPGE